MKPILKTILIVLVGIGIGAAGGYFFGLKQGKTLGREALLAEQKKAQDDELARLQEEANPFDDVEKAANPFRDAYQNPFAQ